MYTCVASSLIVSGMLFNTDSPMYVGDYQDDRYSVLEEKDLYREPRLPEKGKKEDENGPKRGHIMISYNWDHQKLIIKIKNVLKKNDYPVWIDIENMSDTLNEDMAIAVEKSHVVLVCMSEKYRNSPNCRKEAEYANQNNKIILPLMLERNFKLEGWLGLITTGKKYYDFSGKVPFEQKMKELLKDLKKHYGRKNTQSESIEDESSEDEEYNEEARYAEEGEKNIDDENQGEDNVNVEEDETKIVENSDVDAEEASYHSEGEKNKNIEEDDYAEDNKKIDEDNVNVEEDEAKSVENIDDDADKASCHNDDEDKKNSEDVDYVEDKENIEEDGEQNGESSYDNAHDEEEQ